jgi:hypothetical protein
MKKLLITLSLMLLFASSASAALIELEKCYPRYVVLTDNYEPVKSENVKWSKEIYDLYSIRLYKPFSEEEFKNLKKQNPANMTLEYWRYFARFNSELNKDHKKEIADLERKGWIKVNWSEKDIYSINTESGIITRVFILTPEALRALKNDLDWYRAVLKSENKWNNKSNDEYQESYKNFSDPLITTKYKIISYAGGVIVAKEINSVAGKRLTIDLKSNIIDHAQPGDLDIFQFQSKYICKPLSGYADNNINFKSYWWVLVLLGAIVFYVYTQTSLGKNNKTKIVNK